MFLSDIDIEKAVKNKKVRIDNFNITRLNPASYDILLGNKFIVNKEYKSKIIDPVNKIYQLPEIYRIISMIFAFGLSFFTYFIFLKNKISFILITKKDKDDKDNYDKKEKNSLIIKIIGYLFAIFIGVAGNYVYYLLNLPTN